MNDVLRGVVVVVSLVAWVYSLRFVLFFVGRAARTPRYRPHIVHHVAYMFVAVTLNALLAVMEAIEKAGENTHFAWSEGVRALAQIAIILALAALLRGGSLRRGRTPTEETRHV